VRDLSPITGLVDLEVLRVSGTKIVSLEPNAGLIQLFEFEAVGRALRDGELRWLAGLTRLQRLDLSANALRDLSPLAGLLGLESIRLDDNEITDLMPLARLPAITNIRLRGNRIHDLSALVRFAGLGQDDVVDIGDNLLALVPGFGDYDDLRYLQSIGVDVQYLPQGPAYVRAP
jgi:internalin A